MTAAPPETPGTPPGRTPAPGPARRLLQRPSPFRYVYRNGLVAFLQRAGNSGGFAGKVAGVPGYTSGIFTGGVFHARCSLPVPLLPPLRLLVVELPGPRRDRRPLDAPPRPDLRAFLQAGMLRGCLSLTFRSSKMSPCPPCPGLALPAVRPAGTRRRHRGRRTGQLAAVPPDFIVLDLMLPDGNGAEVLWRVRGPAALPRRRGHRGERPRDGRGRPGSGARGLMAKPIDVPALQDWLASEGPPRPPASPGPTIRPPAYHRSPNVPALQPAASVTGRPPRSSGRRMRADTTGLAIHAHAVYAAKCLFFFRIAVFAEWFRRVESAVKPLVFQCFRVSAPLNQRRSSPRRGPFQWRTVH